MKFVIDGVTYADSAAPSLLDLIELQEQSGITVDDMQGAKSYLAKMKESSTSALSDPLALKLIAASIWLARRGAGEQISFRDSAAVPLDRIDFLDDDDEEDEETAPDPLPAPTGGAPDAADEPDISGAVA